MMPLRKAMMSDDRQATIAAFKTANEKMPNDENIMGMQFQFMLGDASTCKQGYAIGERIMKANWDNAQTLNMLAWTVADDGDVAERNLSFAMKAAARAVELTDNKDASVLDTLARVYWEQAQEARNMAVTLQEQAIAIAQEGPMKDSLESTLAGYTQTE